MSEPRPVHVLYFAWLRERVGRSEQHVLLPDGVRSVGALIEHLAALGEGYADAFAHRATLRCAVNQEIAGPDAAVAPGDEVAFFPPVTGG